VSAPRLARGARTVPCWSARARQGPDRVLRLVGPRGEANELKVAMNHAAESAVSAAKPVL
jgi:hypothetical protein